MYQLLRISLISVCIFFLLPMRTVAVERLPIEIYIAGFVLDDRDQGIPGAAITVTYEHEKLFALRSTDSGWFESTRPLTDEYLGKEIALTVLKVGFEFAQKQHLLKEVENFIVFHLKPLEEVPIKVPKESLASGVIYGYVRDLMNNQPLPGAKVTFVIDEIETVSVSSRDSGYFRLSFPAKHLNKLATYTVTYPDLEENKGQVRLGQQNDVIRISLFPKWFRFAGGAALGVYIRAIDGSTERFSIPGSSVVFFLSWFPYKTTPQHQQSPQSNFSLDVGLGTLIETTVETTEDEEPVSKTELLPYGQFGISWRSSLGIHIQTGVSLLREEGEFKWNWYVGWGVPFLYF